MFDDFWSTMGGISLPHYTFLHYDMDSCMGGGIGYQNCVYYYVGSSQPRRLIVSVPKATRLQPESLN